MTEIGEAVNPSEVIQLNAGEELRLGSEPLPQTLVFGRRPEDTSNVVEIPGETKVKLISKNKGALSLMLSRRQLQIDVFPNALGITNLGKHHVSYSLGGENQPKFSLDSGQKINIFNQDVRNLRVILPSQDIIRVGETNKVTVKSFIFEGFQSR